MTALATVSPPNPQSNIPIGRSTIGQGYARRAVACSVRGAGRTPNGGHRRSCSPTAPPRSSGRSPPTIAPPSPVPRTAAAGEPLPPVLLAEADVDREGARALHPRRLPRPRRARGGGARRVHRLGELRAVAGRDDADVAFLVDDEHQGKGIATLLLEHLAAIARTNGIKRFTAEVLSDNRAMLRVFSRAGWPVQRHFESGVTELEFPLTDTERVRRLGRAARAPGRQPRRSPRLLLARSIAVIGASDDRGHDRPRALAQRRARLRRSGVPGEPEATTRSADSRPTRPSPTSTTRSRSRSSPCPPRRWRPRSTQCIAKRVRGAVIVTAIEGTDIDMARAGRRGRGATGCA